MQLDTIRNLIGPSICPHQECKAECSTSAELRRHLGGTAKDSDKTSNCQYAMTRCNRHVWRPAFHRRRTLQHASQHRVLSSVRSRYRNATSRITTLGMWHILKHFGKASWTSILVWRNKNHTTPHTTKTKNKNAFCDGIRHKNFFIYFSFYGIFIFL